jgi:uncharacterized protein YjbI with pentapeptide repeats
LYSANLRSADLCSADLRSANLYSAVNISEAAWTGALYSRYTSWPPGFDPKAHGAVEVEA